MAVVALATVLSVPLFAQVNEGTIQGGVYDQTGAVIVGAKVTVLDVARGIAHPFVTDTAGQYVAVNLTPGIYTVRAESPGFKTFERSNIHLEVGQSVRVDLTLQPGQQTQTITVSAENVQIDTTDAVMGGTITNEAINQLPVNGRNFLKLLDLRPGSVYEMGGTEGSGQGQNTSFNGLRPQDNLFLMEGLPQFSPDGQPIVNQSLGGPGSILSMDAIQEFSTQTNPEAEFGWKDGGVVNIGIKSGTNDIHGTAFAYGRDGAWDAGNFFAGPQQLAMEQYGGTAGGPIKKNKMFWFADFEAQTYNVGVPANPTIPSDVAMGALDPKNQLSMVDACNTVGRANVKPASALLAGLPAGSCTPVASSSSNENIFPYNPSTNLTYLPGFSNNVSNYGGLIKGDYQINSHNHLDGTFYKNHQDSTSYTAAAIQPQWSTLVPVDVLMYTGAWTWTPKTDLVNEFRGGYATIHSIRAGGDNTESVSAAWPNGYGIYTGVTNPVYGGLPIIKISGFSGQLGVGTASGVRGPEGNIDLSDHLSYLRGKHSLKFGVDYMWQIFKGSTYKNANGTISFNSLQDFLTGTVKSASIGVGNPALDAGSSNWGVFAQDDWRVSTRVTLNLGVRWEYYASPNEANNYIGNFYPNVNPATTSAIGQAGGLFPSLFNPNPHQFSPRVGVAWDIGGNQKTVLRAGGSLLYNIPVIGDDIDAIPFGASFLNPAVGLNINNSGTNIGQHNFAQFSFQPSQINWNLTATQAGAMQNPVFAVAGPQTINGVTYTGQVCAPLGLTATSAPCDPIGVEPNMQASRTAEWNIDIERALTSSLSIDIAYVGNHEFDGLSRENVNEPPLGAGWNNPTTGLPAGTALLGGESPAAACIGSAATGYNMCSGNKAILKAVTANETAAETYPQFPYLQFITMQGNQWWSNYNGLQVTVNQRVAHGLSFLASFTHDNSLDFTTSGGWGGPWEDDIRNPGRNYGPSGLDVKNRFTFSTEYNIPGIKSPAQLLEGWQINGIVNLQGGLRWNPIDNTSDLEGTGEYNDPNTPASQFWNYNGPRNAFTSAPHDIPCFGTMTGCSSGIPAACVNAVQANYAGNATLEGLGMAALTNLGCYVQNGGVLTPPAYGTMGDSTRGIFTGPPFYDADISLAKNWTIKERYTAQFRAEFFNIFNHPAFALPASEDPEKGNTPNACAGFGASCTTPDTGDPLGAGGPRHIQLGLKFVF